MTNSEIVLRGTARQLREFWSQDSGTSIHLVAADNLDAAADTILTLKAENDALREALRPFSEKAAYADALGAADDDYVDCAPFRAVEYRNARASTGEQP